MDRDDREMELWRGTWQDTETMKGEIGGFNWEKGDRVI